MAMISTTALYLSFLLASFHFLQSLPATSANARFINETCNNTPNPSYCMKTLLSEPHSLNITTIDGLANIALNIAIRGADYATSQASDLSDKYAGQTEQEALDQCIQIYSNASDDLKDAQTDLSSKIFDDAERLTCNGEDASDNCEGAFASRSLKSLMSDTSKMVKDQCGLSGDIIDLLNTF